MPPLGVGEQEYQHNVLLATLVLGHVSVNSSSRLNGCDERGARDSRCNDIFPASDRKARYFLAWMVSLQDLERLEQAFQFKSIFSPEVIWLVHME